MQTIILFGDVLEAADKLPLEEQESLIEILQQRMIEHRRAELAKDIEAARQEFRRGHIQSVTPSDIINEILS
jgi:hypothetical protein